MRIHGLRGNIGTYQRMICLSQNPDANIKTLDNAFWFAIETITTVAYGEYYPVTPIGRAVSSLLMFAAIGIIWTLIALVSSRMIAKRIKETPVGLVDETKTAIKNRIDEVEKLSGEEMEELISMIRSLNTRLAK
jgi:voltage-gated potassium channel